MKLTHETLKKLYVNDLKLPDTFHGRDTPKTKYPQMWESFNTTIRNSAIDVVAAMQAGHDVWVWSDQHFGHKNIIGYANRPFSTIEEMNNTMIANYKLVVKPTDIVIWTGDIAFMSESKTSQLLKELPGYKIHIVGNHDIDKKTRQPYVLEVDEQYPCYALNLDDITLAFTHYPMDNIPKNCHNVAGHIHQNHANKWNTIVCVEHTNYAPKNLKDILATLI